MNIEVAVKFEQQSTGRTLAILNIGNGFAKVSKEFDSPEAAITEIAQILKDTFAQVRERTAQV